MYMYCLMLFWYPFGLFYALFGWHDWYQNTTYSLLKEHMPPYAQSWQYYFNDPVKNEQLLIIR